MPGRPALPRFAGAWQRARTGHQAEPQKEPKVYIGIGTLILIIILILLLT